MNLGHFLFSYKNTFFYVLSCIVTKVQSFFCDNLIPVQIETLEIEIFLELIYFLTLSFDIDIAIDF
jgi:hypothetical protein